MKRLIPCQTLTLTLVAGLWAINTACAASFDHAHPLWDKVLKAHVKEGLVDYKALMRDSQRLDRYLDEVAKVRRAQFDQWTQPQQLAFLINLYNAFTLRLVLDHYPVESIKDIGGFFSGPWDQEVVRLFDRKTTLGHVEHDILRAKYQEARIHFGIVCAAMGCPPLRAEAYTADRLGTQLDHNGKVFLRDSTKNRVDPSKKVLWLSPIFKWFKEDFRQDAGSVMAFVRPYLPEKDAAKLDQRDYKIRYTDYDWSLNAQGAR